MTPALVLALARGTAVCLATGGLTCLTMFTQLGKWEPALVAGGAAACSVALSQLGVSGAVAGVKNAKSTVTSAVRPGA